MGRDPKVRRVRDGAGVSSIDFLVCRLHSAVCWVCGAGTYAQALSC